MGEECGTHWKLVDECKALSSLTKLAYPSPESNAGNDVLSVCHITQNAEDATGFPSTCFMLMIFLCMGVYS